MTKLLQVASALFGHYSSDDLVLESSFRQADLAGRSPLAAGDLPLPAYDASVFVHLVNDGSSVEANVDLQCEASRLAPEAGVDQVIVPLGFATLQWPSPATGDRSAFNLGFKTPLADGYITGKLAAAQVWVD